MALFKSLLRCTLPIFLLFAAASNALPSDLQTSNLDLTSLYPNITFNLLTSPPSLSSSSPATTDITVEIECTTHAASPTTADIFAASRIVQSRSSCTIDWPNAPGRFCAPLASSGGATIWICGVLGAGYDCKTLGQIATVFTRLCVGKEKHFGRAGGRGYFTGYKGKRVELRVRN